MQLEDQPFCISTILNLDQKAILPVDTLGEHMKAFWDAVIHHVHGVPQNIIFNQYQRLLGLTGYHWAPSTLQRDPNNTTARFYDPTRGRDRRADLLPGVGLKVRYPDYAIRLSMRSSSRLPTAVLQNNKREDEGREDRTSLIGETVSYGSGGL